MFESHLGQKSLSFLLWTNQLWLDTHSLRVHVRERQAQKKAVIIWFCKHKSLCKPYMISMHNAESCTHKTTPQDGQLIVHVGHQ